MKKNDLPSHLHRLAERAIPPAGVDLWPAIRARYEVSQTSLPEAPSMPGHPRRVKTMKAISGFARSAAWIFAAAGLIALVSWSIRGFTPQPAGQDPYPMASETTVGNPASPTHPTYTAAPEATPSPIHPSSSSLLPGVSLRLEAAFPAAPSEAVVYTQDLAQPLSLESALEIAAQLGVQGDIYTAPSEGSGIVYTVTDGQRSVIFVEKASYYSYTELSALAHQGVALPFEEQKVIAEAFLEEHGLAGFPHTFEALDNNAGTIRVVPLIEDLPVRHDAFDGPHIDLTINDQGQVSSLGYAWPGAVPGGSFPILSAGEAWQRVLEGNERGMSISWLLDRPRTLQTWTRTYPAGQSVVLYGYFGRPLQPVEAGVEPLMTFANLPAKGERLAEFLQAFQVTDFIQVTGQVRADKRGKRFFELEGWQLSPYEDLMRSGTIRRQGDTVILESEGQSLLLPDVPASVPEGLPVELRGVWIDGPQPTFDWSYIQSGTTGEWGNLLVNSFAQIDLGAAPAPTGTPLPAGSRPGDRVEGLEATVSLYPGGIGLITLDESHWFYVQPPYPDGLSLLSDLPVRVWGAAGEPVNDQPSIRIERYEEIYPGLRMQAWLGTWENAHIDGQAVLLFTAQDSTLEGVVPGTQYVLFSPPLTTGGPEVHAGVGLPGRTVIYEGLLLPGQQFGGFPVIHTYSGAVEDIRTNLDGYELTVVEPFMPGEDSAPRLPPGEVAIETIELIYFTEDTRGGLVDPNFPIYVQPAWRFTGRYADGTKLEILVQALREEYLN